jgi:hypothetical protein
MRRFISYKYCYVADRCWSQWPRGLRRSSAAARPLGRSPAEIVGSSVTGGTVVCCERCERCGLSGRGLCDELITRLEESYRLCCVAVYDLEIS